MNTSFSNEYITIATDVHEGLVKLQEEGLKNVYFALLRGQTVSQKAVELCFSEKWYQPYTSSTLTFRRQAELRCALGMGLPVGSGVAASDVMAMVVTPCWRGFPE